MPCCRSCNKREKVDGKEVDWKVHLKTIVKEKGHSNDELSSRRTRIENHIKNYNYPGLEMTLKKKDKIKSVAEWLYNEVQDTVKRSKDIYLSK